MPDVRWVETPSQQAEAHHQRTVTVSPAVGGRAAAAAGAGQAFATSASFSYFARIFAQISPISCLYPRTWYVSISRRLASRARGAPGQLSRICLKYRTPE